MVDAVMITRAMHLLVRFTARHGLRTGAVAAISAACRPTLFERGVPCNGASDAGATQMCKRYGQTPLKK